ncbi:sporulation-related RNA polymerase-binding protein YlyA [Bacillus subtilis]|uniref:sporulation-related RNA polymerase-binding protein YlyA n=1 Tax=Bacillus subtilis TaxID=1423 RepID=UPI002DB7D808|nr:sporulation-related RNA polymerase-binding protein YlyA [Bacillus subtilis]MEC2220772.1 sporulation-related RNA polymerase-binding protein YlyA [Bacillus subtilis]
MNDQLTAIYTELLLMKEELQSRLFEYSCFQVSTSPQAAINQKQKATLIYHIKEELQDVLLALSKIENGTFGYCEETGAPIPLAKLAVLPTARTANDFLYSVQFEKKTLPIWKSTGIEYGQALYE